MGIKLFYFIVFNDLLNPTQPPSVAETELEDDGVSSPISLGEVTVVVKQLHSGKAPGIDEIPPELLKAGFWGAVSASNSMSSNEISIPNSFSKTPSFHTPEFNVFTWVLSWEKAKPRLKKNPRSTAESTDPGVNAEFIPNAHKQTFFNTQHVNSVINSQSVHLSDVQASLAWHCWLSL